LVFLGGDGLDKVYDPGGPFHRFHDVDQIRTKRLIIGCQQSLESLNVLNLEVLLQLDEATDGFPQEVICGFVLRDKVS
jgi:hypothetical protein